MIKYAQQTDVKKIKLNPDNPRVIKDDAYQRLVKSIQEFPEMLELRPIVIDENGVILGGNMRYKACIDAGLTKVPTVQASTLTEEQKREFVVKDNLPYGEWDWEALQGWDDKNLTDWGLDLPQFPVTLDYTILKDGEPNHRQSEMSESVVKAIQIEFALEQYQEALDLIRYFRSAGANIGTMILEFLKQQKTLS